MNGYATIAAASLFFTAISQATQGQEATRAPLSSGHPLIGSWWAEFPKFKCSEEFEIRADGTRVSRSGEERNESEFVITPLPSAKGYYKFTDRITKNNGKPDCFGSVTPVGDVAVNYVLVHPSGQRLALCSSEELSSCMAVYYRKPSK